MLTGELPDKFSIGSARRAAKLMVEMSNVRPVAKVHQRIKHGNRICSTGDSGQKQLTGLHQCCFTQSRQDAKRFCPFAALRLCVIHRYGLISAVPPMYGFRISGSFTLPSDCW